MSSSGFFRSDEDDFLIVQSIGCLEHYNFGRITAYITSLRTWMARDIIGVNMVQLKFVYLF